MNSKKAKTGTKRARRQTAKSPVQGAAVIRPAEAEAVGGAGDAGAGDEPIVKETTFTYAQSQFLVRVARFLIAVVSPRFTRRAQREGYTKEEHATGWRLYREAGGEERPLAHWFAEQSLVHGPGAATENELRVIDDFENLWFPRTRAIIRRVVPAASREAFTAAFFQNLEQQPLGPGVVGSVGTFLGRVEALATSTEPGAQAVLASLAARGLTAGKMRDMRAMIRRVVEGEDAPAVSPVDPRELEKAQKAQEEALAELRDWFNDWATTLRTAFNGREQIALGLTLLKRGGGEDAAGDGPAPVPPVSPAPAQTAPDTPATGAQIA